MLHGLAIATALALSAEGPLRPTTRSYSGDVPLEQARLCLDLRGERGVEACRRALAASMPAERSAALRGVLAGKLAALRRWDDVADVYREAVQLRPDDAVGQLRLGSALLFLVGRPGEAIPPLRDAVRLDPRLPEAHGTLGIAFAALGEPEAAVAALEEARRLDPEYMDTRPASRLVYEAARRGERWP